VENCLIHTILRRSVQALLSQLTQLQLVFQDLENEKKASAHEASESLLQIKLENKKIYAKLLRQSESATAEVYIDFQKLFIFFNQQFSVISLLSEKSFLSEKST
jgi:hypothetical protein